MRCVKEEENYEGEMDQAQGGGDGTPLLFGDEAKKDAKQSLENQDGSKVLPFEFVALEACLEAASSSLESEVYICSYGYGSSTPYTVWYLH